jgi:glycosyltransferase involved in cell wall biosynthesis
VQWRGLVGALSDADLVTCDSDDLKRTITSGLGVSPTKVEVVQWGVDTDAFAPEGPNMREALGLSTRDVVFSVRNFTPLYNQETVVEAFSRLRSQRPGAFLLMKNYGGAPDYVNRIRADIRARKIEDHCRIVESIAYEKMPDLYRTANVTVSIPSSDATPMSLLEAMACGAIPVCSDLPSIREWITDGQNGFLVRHDDPDAIAKRMLLALDGSPVIATFSTKNRLLVEQRASQHVHMRRMAQLYNAISKTARVTDSSN